MKKFINHADDFLEQSLSGLQSAHPELLQVHKDPFFVTRKNINPHKVQIISGGGSGHEPLHTGFIGHGMLDIACPGHIFTSPTPDQMIAAIEYCQPKNGVLMIVKNYSGDVMNFEMASEMIDTKNATILTNDDAAVINSSYTEGKRGVAGTLIVEKVVGSLAESGASLEECQQFGLHANNLCSSIGVALTSCTIPAAGKPTFDIENDQIEFGVGIHGEPGRRREAIREANLIVSDMVEAIFQDFRERDVKIGGNSEFLVVVNGFGATPLSELYLIFNSVTNILNEKQLNIGRSLVGNFTTALDMAGASVTLCLLDDAIQKNWDSSVYTPSLRWGI